MEVPSAGAIFERSGGSDFLKFIGHHAVYKRQKRGKGKKVNEIITASLRKKFVGKISNDVDPLNVLKW